MKSDDVDRLIEQRKAQALEALDEMVAENQRLGLYDDAPEVTPEVTPYADAVNMTPDRVDETAKGEHEPLYMDMSQVPTGMPDWKPGMVFPAPKKEWVGLTDEEVGTLTVFDGLHHIETPLLADFIRAIEAKLKEKNGG